MKYFSEKTNSILNEWGWDENYNINIHEAVEMLEDRSYTISDSFKNFYSHFGDLILYAPINGLNEKRYISFSIKESFGIDYDELIINLYPKAIGCKTLDLIGNIDHTSALVINENGIIYLLYDGDATKLGNSTYEAIDNLCTKEWRWFDQFSSKWNKRWNGETYDFNFAMKKEIENHKNFIKKYPTYKSFYE